MAIGHARGGSTGVFAYPDKGLDSLAPTVTGLDMTVSIDAGACLYNNVITRTLAATNDFTGDEPVSNPRIDIMAIDCENKAMVVIEGVEAASPVAPATPANHLKLCEVYHYVGETKILAADTTPFTEGYITDSRLWVNV